MHNEQIRSFLLNHKGELIGLSKDDSQEFIDEVNYLSDKGFLKESGNCYILSAKSIDFLADMDKKGLEIRILEHLKEQNAKAHKIDIAAPFLLNDDSYENRLNVCKSIEYLEKEKFIDLQGNPYSLCSKMAGEYGSKYITGIKATITKLGEIEINPPIESPSVIHAPVSHNYNFEKSQTPIVNSTVQDSFLNLANNLDVHTNNNTNPNKPTNRSWIEVLYWIAGIIVGGLLLYEFIIKHLKWV